MDNILYLSYILPCYNTGQFIKKCIESLYRQRLDENLFEVIIVNNDTKDNSESIILELIKHHTNIKYVKLEANIYSGGAYNSGLAIARGRYIQFVDSDDYLKDNMMGRILPMMDKENLDILYFNIESFRDDIVLTKEERLLYNGNFISSFNVDNCEEYLGCALKQLPIECLPVPAYRKMIRRSLLIESNICFTETTIGCDYLHNLRLILYAKKIKVTTDRVYMFRFNPNGVTKSRISSEAIIFALNNYSDALKMLPSTGLSQIINKALKCNLEELINVYIGSMKWLDFKERSHVLCNVKDIDLVKRASKGFINNSMVKKNRYCSLFMTPLLFKFIKKIR